MSERGDRKQERSGRDERSRSRERRPVEHHRERRPQEDADADASKLFVGNLSFETDDRDLKDIFGKFGSVIDVRVISDRDTGRSRGFAFVTMENKGDAARAMTDLQGKDIKGREIRIDVSTPKGSSGRGGGGGGYNGGRSSDGGGSGYGNNNRRSDHGDRDSGRSYGSGQDGGSRSGGSRY